MSMMHVPEVAHRALVAVHLMQAVEGQTGHTKTQGLEEPELALMEIQDGWAVESLPRYVMA